MHALLPVFSVLLVAKRRKITRVIRNQNGVEITLIPVIYFVYYSERFVGKERSK